MPPPLRFWEFDRERLGDPPPPTGYGSANSGCADPVLNKWLINLGVDCGGPHIGQWLLQQADWANARVDGCPVDPGAVGPARTVAEISDVVPPVGMPPTSGETTPDHASWYLAAAVEQEERADFDRIDGGNSPAGLGCGRASVRWRPVTDLTIVGRTDPCTGSGVETRGTANGQDFFNITVVLTDPTPAYFTEVGMNDPATPVIEGYQILFAEGTEPTTSRNDRAVWKPVLDPADPSRPLGTVRYGTERVEVAIPVDAGAGPLHWIAARLAYTDCSLNGSTLVQTSCTRHNLGSAEDPPVGSQVGPHCGPVRL